MTKLCITKFGNLWAENVNFFGRTPNGAYGNTHSVLRRVLRTSWEGFWGRVLKKGSEKGAFSMGFTVRQGSEKGSQKGF